MPKIKVTDLKGLIQESGSGFEAQGAMYGGVATTTAAATGSFTLLTHAPFQTVDSANNAHGVRLPNALGAGQLMVIRNVDSGQDVVIRNQDQTGAILVTLGEGKTAIFISTAAGDNWSGSQVD